MLVCLPSSAVALLHVFAPVPFPRRTDEENLNEIMAVPLQVVHNAYTPKEGLEISSRAGAYKAKMRIDKIILSSFMAGALLSFAGACNVIIQTSPWFQDNAPGLIKMMGALIFPFGLVIIIMTGADLTTGSFMVRRCARGRRCSSTGLLVCASRARGRFYAD